MSRSAPHRHQPSYLHRHGPSQAQRPRSGRQLRRGVDAARYELAGRPLGNPAGLLLSGRTAGLPIDSPAYASGPCAPSGRRRRQRGGRQERAAVTDRGRAAARVSGTPLIK
ncbi:hypothetical protein EF913_05920 [Streptomyces sp. WAC04189]|nr:hypothetical protein EF913_05920 [Streptomyces sp. WAC04189]RSS30995.1 hypothetical protein EF916_05975 [Streptomyces sp. WAC08452]RSS74907.1 hypothetical protein EF911_11735 [Streptomyces sp. WAC06128]